MPIIEMLDRRARARTAEPFMQIIDADGRVHMANLDIHFTHSTNGVAALHTEILKNTELAPFYKLYPEKFNNKTNGITFRRWLMGCDPALAALITDAIGPGWKKDAGELERLLAKKGDTAFLEKLLDRQGGQQARADRLARRTRRA
jgi:starch phosphorylase